MTKLEKIEKWAKENGYIAYPAILEQEYIVSKRHGLNNGRYATLNIIVDLWNGTIKSCLNVNNVFCDIRDKDQLEELFIPLNNVKRDEKLLKEYLEND